MFLLANEFVVSKTKGGFNRLVSIMLYGFNRISIHGFIIVAVSSKFFIIVPGHHSFICHSLDPGHFNPSSFQVIKTWARSLDFTLISLSSLNIDNSHYRDVSKVYVTAAIP